MSNQNTQIITTPDDPTNSLIKGLHHLNTQGDTYAGDDLLVDVNLKGGKSKKTFHGKKVGGKKKECKVMANNINEAAALCLWKLYPNKGKQNILYQVSQKGGKPCPCGTFQGRRVTQGNGRYKYTYNRL